MPALGQERTFVGDWYVRHGPKAPPQGEIAGLIKRQIGQQSGIIGNHGYWR